MDADIVGKVHDLEARADKDEALWNDEHTSDEEAFDPEKPDDLKTENAKLEDGDEEEDDDEDDSIVCDDVEDACAHHKECVKAAQDVCEFLVSRGMFVRASKKERVAALAEAICDHFASAAPVVSPGTPATESLSESYSQTPQTE